MSKSLMSYFLNWQYRLEFSRSFTASAVAADSSQQYLSSKSAAAAPCTEEKNKREVFGTRSHLQSVRIFAFSEKNLSFVLSQKSLLQSVKLPQFL